MTFKVKERVCTCERCVIEQEYDETYIDEVFPPDGTTLVAVLMAEVRKLREALERIRDNPNADLGHLDRFGDYARGVGQGAHVAAKIARAALGERSEP